MRKTAAEEWALTAAGGLYGIAVAVACSGWWTFPAPGDQIPGILQQRGLDARVPFFDLIAVIVLVFAMSLAARALARRLRHSPPAVSHAVTGALLLGAWSGIARPVDVASQLLPAAMLQPLVNDDVDPGLVLAAGIGGAAICWLLRKRIATFRSGDLILVPVSLSAYMALGELAPEASVQLLTTCSIALPLLLRFASGHSAKPWGFMVPAATLALHAPPLETSMSPYAALAAIVIWPLLAAGPFRAAATSGERRRRIVRVAALVVYPLIAFTYPHTHSLTRTEGMPRVDIFEDGHFLLPASEMARGERPFRDIIPQHGLLSDGAIEALAIELGANDLGALLWTRELVASLNAVALYFVLLAATGSPHCAIAGFIGSAAFLLTGTTFLRSAPSLFVLAFAAGALRRRSVRMLTVGAALVPLALLTAPEFGAMALVVCAISCWFIGRTLRRRAAIRSAIWIASSLAVITIVLAALGVPWLTVTLRDVLSAGPAYGMGRVELPPAISARMAIPEIAGALFVPSEFLHIIWFEILLATAGLSVRPASRRTAPLIALGAWTVLAGVSYAQRHQLYLRLTVIAFLTVAAFVLLRRRSRAVPLGAALALLILIAVQPTMHLTLLRFMRNAHGPLDPAVREWQGVPRARGALFRGEDIPRLETMRQALTTLRPGETFFDYSNTPILYYLFDRPCPIRQTDVPFYEPPRLQREVVNRLERDPNVRIALLGFTHSTTIDGIPNEQRTPIVAEYLKQAFTPASSENGVIVWQRAGTLTDTVK